MNSINQIYQQIEIVIVVKNCTKIQIANKQLTLYQLLYLQVTAQKQCKGQDSYEQIIKVIQTMPSKKPEGEVIAFELLDGSNQQSEVIVDNQQLDEIYRIIDSNSIQSTNKTVSAKKRQISILDSQCGDQSFPMVLDEESDEGLDKQSNEDYTVEQYKHQLFGNIKNNCKSSSTCIDIDSLAENEEMDLAQVKRRKKLNDNLNVKIIMMQIQREKRLDDVKTNKQKKNQMEFLQIEPGRRPIRKTQKKQKVISKKTLDLISKKFDEYYAYESNFNYKGPKISLREIGQTFDIGANSVHKLYNQWCNDPSFYDRLIRYDLDKKVPQRKLTLERLEHVARIIKQNPFMTQSQVCVELNKIEDLKSWKDGIPQQINKSMIAKLLKIGKFKKKRVRYIPKQKNTSKSLQKRYDFCTKYKQLLDKQAKIYFLDESGFNLYMTRDKAWSRANEEITVNCPISKGKRFSLIAIIGEDGLAHWRIIQGTYRKYQYIDFITELFQKLSQHSQHEHYRENWLIMDNCAIHDKEQTMSLAKEYNISVMYLPAYSPQLNPIQMWFHEVKTKIRKINYQGQRQLLQIMERTLKEYEEHDFSNYYHGSLKYVTKGLKRQRF